MGRKVNVVLWDGTVRSVDEETAKLLDPQSSRRETDQENLSRATSAVNEDRSSGFHEGAKAAAEGLLDTATAGIFGKFVSAGDPDWAENMRARGDVRGGSRLLGEGVGLLLPTSKLGGATAPGLAQRAGQGIAARTGSKAAGHFAEGAILGMGAQVAQTNVTGDPLTIESLVAGGGVGGILEMGAAKLGDKLLGAGERAKEAVAKAAREKETLSLAAKGDELFGRTESYSSFKGAHDDYIKSARKNNTAAEAEEKARNKALTAGGMKRAEAVVKRAHAEVLARRNQTAYAQDVAAAEKANRTAREAYEAAGAEGQAAFEAETAATSQAYEQARKKYDTFVNSTEKFPGALDKFKKAIKSIEERPGAKLKPEEEVRGQFADAVRQAAEKAQRFGDRKAFISSVYENMDPAFRGQSIEEFKSVLIAAHKKGDIVLSRADLVSAMDPALVQASHAATDGAEFHFITIGEGKPPKLQAPDRAKEFNRRLSVAMQKRGKGWAGEPGHWEATGTPDVDGAMADLHALRADIAREYPGLKLPDLPEIPKAPEVAARPQVEAPATVLPTAERTTEDLMLAEANRDISATIEAARRHSAKGDYAMAAAEYEALGARMQGRGMGDLEILPKNWPAAPRPRIDVDDIDLPKTVEEFARKTPEQIERLSASVGKMPREVGASFEKMARDLDLELKPTIADTIASTHRTLGMYASAMDDLAKSVRDEAVKRGDKSAIAKMGDFAKRGVRYGFARLVDTGGLKGAVMGTMAGGIVGSILDRAEDGMLGGSLLASRAAMRGKLNAMVAKIAPRAGRAFFKLAPVSAHLGGKFPSGEKDRSKDISDLAYNRIGDVMAAVQAAPDAVYEGVQGALGAPGDIAWKTHQFVLGALNHLAMVAPKDPGLDVTLSGSNWRPSREQSLAFAHRIEAVQDPLAAIARSISGDGHPAATETLWAVYPSLMSEFAQEFLASPVKRMSYEAQARMASLLRVKVGLQEPVVITALQGLYLPSPQNQNQTAQASQPGAPGRPAAIQSPVAGSSVTALTA